MSLGPLFSGEDARPLHHGSFAGTGGDDALAFTISGRFEPNGSVTGTVNLAVQEACFSGDVSWTAHVVPGGPS